MNAPPQPKLIRSDRRTLALHIDEEGLLVVRAPLKAPDRLIREFIQKNEAWIEKTSERVKARRQERAPRQFVEGELFPYLGNDYPLHIAEDMFGKFLFEDQFILSAKHLRRAPKLFERWYREEAFRVFTERCAEWAKLMGLKYQAIKLSSAKRRWGSCSTRGSLCFNWKLVMAPLAIIDYVVVHELSHLKYHNHSEKFWELVEAFYPEHQAAKKWLKEKHLGIQ